MRRSRAVDVNKQGERLQHKHSLLKARVRELDERIQLSAHEERERVELKKEKLITKDALATLVSEPTA